MFPLGSVVFPHTAIPLRIFETRYQLLLDKVTASDSNFGMVLIERGFEVGGGDERFSIGTLVRVGALSEPNAEGHRAVVVIGVGRIAVRQWLPDDPHPQAVVEEYPDLLGATNGLFDQAVGSLRKVLGLASELGADVSGMALEFAEDAVAASYQLAALCPVTPLDSQRLLEAPGPVARVQMAIELLDIRAEMLIAELANP
jgi:hypothetical protein